MVNLVSIAVEIKSFLDSFGQLGDIRVGDLPESPNTLGAIIEYGGQSVEGRFGVIGVGYERPSFQLIFRGEPNNYKDPMAKARFAWDVLAGVQPGVIPSGTSVYLQIIPQQSPFSMGKDLNLRYEIACNYYTRKEP